MKIAIHGRNFTESARPFIQSLFDDLSARQIDVQLSADYRIILDNIGIAHKVSQVYESPEALFDADFIFSLGGDGTLLDAVTHVGARQIPIVGINVGRLGFLATISPPELPSLIATIEAGLFRLDHRSLVCVETDENLFGSINFGLNDFTITKTDTSSMITVHAYMNGEFLNSYWADGLIISTPTGSTGYSLSCGGPVLVPQTQSFIVTPVSPHNLNVRPMVVEDSAVLSFDVKSRSGSFLISLDARSQVVNEGTRIKVRKADFVARLVKMTDDSFFNTLRNKLSWGLDMRN
ncbi:NAD kinase [Telluribacter sp. SYSU D00476]|uniref:NAD kinase n=1 Tax=Telluribacter sp. SYSU D00476 TaxID=2811430 RepID=UPI001FF1544B|nr:NAD kinase [Telluribacter sp. SYSU D00476]